MNGLTHVIALAGVASAVAVAAIFTVLTPNIEPISVSTGLPRAAVRKHVDDLTRFAAPLGLSGNVTSVGWTSELREITLLCFAALIALSIAGPARRPVVPVVEVRAR